MSARRGVMSDVAIKSHCPEFFPPDLTVSKAMHPMHLQTHIFKGIKTPRETKTYTDFARFPINDLQNFASLAHPHRSEQASFEALLNYRRRIGSENHPKNIQTGYEEQMKATHKPYPMEAATTIVESSTYGTESDVADLDSLRHYSSVPASLTLGKFKRDEAIRDFYKNVSSNEHRYIFDDKRRHALPSESKALIANLGDRTHDLLDIVYPGGHLNKMTHGQVLSSLNEAYRDSPSDLAIIMRADAAAKSRDVIPDQSSLTSSIIGPSSIIERIEEENDQ